MKFEPVDRGLRFECWYRRASGDEVHFWQRTGKGGFPRLIAVALRSFELGAMLLDFLPHDHYLHRLEVTVRRVRFDNEREGE